MPSNITNCDLAVYVGRPKKKQKKKDWYARTRKIKMHCKKPSFNTFKFLLIHIPLQLIFALALAEFLNQNIKFKGFYRAAFFLPVIVSGVVVTILWQQLLGFDSGLINRLLVIIGLEKVGWLIDPNIAMGSIAVMATWKNVGLYVILFLVGLQTVPPSYYEAAEIEGASHWQKFRYITLPLINPTIFMVVILSTIGGFSLFIEPYIMTGVFEKTHLHP